MRETYCLMSCGQRWWVLLIGYVSYVPALVVRQLRGIQHMPRMIGLSQFSRLFKDQYALEVMVNIIQNSKLLILVKKELDGLRDPVTCKKYPKWRNLRVVTIPMTLGYKSRLRKLLNQLKKRLTTRKSWENNWKSFKWRWALVKPSGYPLRSNSSLKRNWESL
jgi:hypothetical protein